MSVPTLDLLIDASNPQKNGLLFATDSQGQGQAPLLCDSDGQENVRIRCVVPSNSGVRLYDPLAATLCEIGIGVLEQAPTSGTFPLQYASQTAIAGIAYNVAASDLQTPLAAAITANSDGSATVTQLAPGVYQVSFTTLGAKTLITSPGPNTLSPQSTIGVTRAVTGSSTAYEVQIITLQQNAYAFASLNTALGAITASVETTQAGTSSLPAIQDITLSDSPYDGTLSLTYAQPEITKIVCTTLATNAVSFLLYDDVGSVGVWLSTTGGTIPSQASGAARHITVPVFSTLPSASDVATALAAVLNADSKFVATVGTDGITLTVTLQRTGAVTAVTDGNTGFAFQVVQAGGSATIAAGFDISAANLATALGPGFQVAALNDLTYQITFPVPGAQSLITVDASGLDAYTGVEGSLTTNTFSMLQAFNATSAQTLSLFLQVKLQQPGDSAPRTVYLGTVQVSRTVLNPNTVQPASLPLFFTQTQSDARYLRASNNLSDLGSKTTAQANLGLNDDAGVAMKAIIGDGTDQIGQVGLIINSGNTSITGDVSGEGNPTLRHFNSLGTLGAGAQVGSFQYTMVSNGNFGCTSGNVPYVILPWGQDNPTYGWIWNLAEQDSPVTYVSLNANGNTLKNCVIDQSCTLPPSVPGSRIASWPLNTLSDVEGLFPLTDSGSLETISGFQPGTQAYQGDGTNILTNPNLTLQGLSACLITGFVNPTAGDLSSTAGLLYSWNSSFSGGSGIILMFTEAGNLQVYCKTLSTVFQTSNAVDVGAWNSFAMWFSSTTAYLMLNGVVTSTPCAGTIPSAPDGFSLLGFYQGGAPSNQMTGQLQAVQLYGY